MKAQGMGLIDRLSRRRVPGGAALAVIVASACLVACSSTPAPPPQRVTPRAAAAPLSSGAPNPTTAGAAAPATEKSASAPAASAPAPAARPAGAAAPAASPGPGLTPSGEPIGLAAPKLDGSPSASAPTAPGLAPTDAKAVLDAAINRAKGGTTVPTAPAPAAAGATEKSKADDVVVIDNGDEARKEPRTLVEAARAEKARKENAEHAKIVITDKNLHQYAKKGQITVAAPPKTAAGAPPGIPAVTTADPTHDEQYWRHGALEIRRRWRSAYDRAKELEKSAADWRIRFYAQDDPYVRDGQIKPSWDRALEMLKEAQNEVDISQKELANFLDQGRREGALPGWLREGIEEEPPPPPKPVKPGDAIEPPIAKDPGA
jgi:hypothetical protein